LTAVKTTLSDTNQASKTTFTYDGQGHKTDSYDYDFGPEGSGSIGGLLRRTHTDFNYDCSYDQNSGPYIRNLVSRQWVSSDAYGTNRLAQTDFEYDNYTTDSDGTKDIDQFYDGAIKGKGRFWYSNWDQSNNTRFESHVAIDEYDVMGGPKNEL